MIGGVMSLFTPVRSAQMAEHRFAFPKVTPLSLDELYELRRRPIVQQRDRVRESLLRVPDRSGPARARTAR
jgi:hypothetical protein